MGTNYYHHKLLCEHCGNEEVIHIGKSSAGWRFTFHGTDQLKTYTDWLVRLRSGGKIIDEYHKEWTLQEFIDWVEDKQKKAGPSYSHRHDEQGYEFSDYDFL